MEANKASRVVVACALMMANEEVAEAPNTDAKKPWIKAWMSKKKLGIQYLLYQELLESDPVEYRRLLRVNSDQFADILSSIASCIQKLDTEMRPAIPAKDKLQLTLRFLASGPGPVGVPPVIVGDDAFPLSMNLMKPYTGTNLDDEKVIFNYRLSRARRVAENAFGILANRFRFLHTSIDAEPGRVTSFVKAACVLHNYLRA
ncbi:hypothetical protein HPB47_003451, partial [Ixodes persulcatus]